MIEVEDLSSDPLVHLRDVHGMDVLVCDCCVLSEDDACPECKRCKGLGLRVTYARPGFCGDVGCPLVRQKQ